MIQLFRGLNGYFANGNAWRWRDPSGRFTLMDVMVAGAISGILSAIGTAIPMIGQGICRAQKGEDKGEIFVDLAGKLAVSTAIGAITGALTLGTSTVATVATNLFSAVLQTVITTQMTESPLSPGYENPTGYLIATTSATSASGQIVEAVALNRAQKMVQFQTLIADADFAKYPSARTAFIDGLLDNAPRGAGTYWQGMVEAFDQQLAKAPGSALKASAAFAVTVALIQATTETCH